MTQSFDHPRHVPADDGTFTPDAGVRSALGSPIVSLLPFALVALAAVVLRRYEVANTDVTWLFTVAEKVLDGQRPYIDFVEANPPASILLYLPGVVMAQLLGLSPDRVTDTLVFAAALASLGFAGRVLLRAGLLTDVHISSLAAVIGAVLLILPAQTFAEREHIAVLALLPMLAVYAARSSRVALAPSSAIIAGLAAGLTVSIKPHFALALIAAASLAAWQARSWRQMFAPENWACAAVVLLYAAVVAIAFPQFVTDMLPLVSELYVPSRQPWRTLLLLPALPIWAVTAAAVAVVARRFLVHPPCGILLAGSAGFAVAYLLQGKGWPYHSYPMLALAFIALAWALTEQARTTPPALLGVVVLTAALAFAVAFGWMNWAYDMSALAEPIRRVHPHPRMLAITSDPAMGHPLVRAVGGKWVQSNCGLWITRGVAARRKNATLDAATLARFDRYAERDRAMLLADIRQGKPDVILVDRRVDWESWIRSDPELTDALKSFREVVANDDVSVRERVANDEP